MLNNRNYGEDSKGIAFDEKIKIAVWKKANLNTSSLLAIYSSAFPKPDANEIRIDSFGNEIRYGDYGNTRSHRGWEIDHIFPVAKGGDDGLSNLQPLQWEENRKKSDNYPY